jgi:hypothetical protein
VPYSTTYLQDVDVIVIVYEGEVEPADGHGALAESGELAERHSCRRFLADCTSISAHGTLFDVMAFVEMIVAAPPGPLLREAVVMPLDGAAADSLEFFETACRNRGLDVRVFNERDEALAWLTA